jgi:predicted mannosyl-3-phosphoglycerate phosphatase (HAD superfamily)
MMHSDTRHQPTVAQPRYIVLSDIDGTAVDETLPERRRLSESSQPAAETFRRFASELQVATGLCTARAASEALKYGARLNALSAPAIAEDGGVILLPKEWGDIGQLAMRFDPVPGVRSLREIEGHVAVLTTDDPMGRIHRTLERFDPMSTFVTSLSSAEQLLDSSIGYDTVESAELARGRLASAFIELSDEEAKSDLVRRAAGEGLRVFGLTHLPHLIPQDVSKGSALRVLRDMYHALHGRELRPIVFGNNENDLPMFDVAHEMGGAGIIVEHPSGGFLVQTGDHVIKAHGAFGHGISSSFDIVSALIKKG